MQLTKCNSNDILNLSLSKVYNLCLNNNYKYEECKNYCNDDLIWQQRSKRDLSDSDYLQKIQSSQFSQLTWKEYYFIMNQNNLKLINIYLNTKYIGYIAIDINDTLKNIFEFGFQLILPNLSNLSNLNYFDVNFNFNSTTMFPSDQIYNYLDIKITNNWNIINNSTLLFTSNGHDIAYDNNGIMVLLPSSSSNVKSNKINKINVSESSIDRCAIGLKGHRNTMEDEHIFERYTINSFYIDIYGVFDGHGGKETASILKSELPFFIIRKLQNIDLSDLFNSHKISNILKSSFIEYDQLLFQRRNLIKTSGSTAIVSVIIYTNDSSLKDKIYDIYLINLGDSRGVIAGRRQNIQKAKNNIDILLQSNDHKPSYLYERERIIQSGGTIKDSDIPRVNNRLSVSRAFGDFDESSGFKIRNGDYLGVNSPISPEPDVYYLRFIADQHNYSEIYILLACDGLWDVLSSKEAINLSLLQPLLNNITDMNSRCENLAKIAINYGSKDNISIFISRIYNSLSLTKPNLQISTQPLIKQQHLQSLTKQNLQTTTIQLIQNKIPPPYTTCTKNFDYIKKIGSGSFGQVYQICIKPNECDYIIKYISKYQIIQMEEQKNMQLRLSVEKEYDFLLLASSYNISPKPMQVVTCISGQDNKYIYGIVMEKMDGELTALFLDINISDIILTNLFNQVISLIWTLVNINIWHGDTKICNFLYKTINNNIKIYISDYGLSEYLDRKILSSKLDVPIEQIKIEIFSAHMKLFIQSLFVQKLCNLNITNNKDILHKISRCYADALNQLNLQKLGGPYETILFSNAV